MFKMQIKLRGEWQDVRPPAEPPYTYPTVEAARHMLEVCYPDQMREQRLFGKEFGRVLNEEDNDKRGGHECDHTGQSGLSHCLICHDIMDVTHAQEG